MKIFSFISGLFLKIFRVLKPIFLAVFDAAMQILMAKLKDIATQSITRLASTDLNNEDKRRQAFQDIKTYAISKAISVSDSEINLIIEVFVRALKKQKVIK
jgi:hypothetical protein